MIPLHTSTLTNMERNHHHLEESDLGPVSSPKTCVEDRPPSSSLRRATYVHISDLAKPYNIDITRLKEEIAKLNAAVDAGEDQSHQHDSPRSEAKKGRQEEREENVVVGKDGEANPVKDKDNDEVQSSPSKRVFHPKSFQQKLVPPSGGFNLCLLVGKVDVVVDKLRVDKSRVRLAEVQVGDATGSVSLRARDDQIDTLQEISRDCGSVVLRNATLELYQGRHLRLAVTKWGKMSAYPDHIPSTPPPPSTMNEELNFSRVDLNLVAGDFDTDIENFPSSPNRRRPQTQQEDDSSRASNSRGKNNLQQNQHPHQGYRKGGRDRRHQRQVYANTSTHNNTLVMYQNPDSSSVGSGPPNPAMMTGMSSFNPIYGNANPLFAYMPPHAMVDGTQRHHRQPMNDQQTDHQKQQQQLLFMQYEMQQRQLEQMQLYRHQQERHRRMFVPPSQGHQSTNVLMGQHDLQGNVENVGDYALSSMGSNFIITQPMGGAGAPQSIAGTQSHGGMSAAVTSATAQREQLQTQQQHLAFGIGNVPNNASSTDFGSPPNSQVVATQNQRNDFSVSNDDQRFGSNVEQHRYRTDSWGQEHRVPGNLQVPGSAMDVQTSPPMNPRAASFAPSYANAVMMEMPQQHFPSQSFPYSAYNPSEGQIYDQQVNPPNHQQVPSHSEIHNVAVSTTSMGYEAKGSSRNTKDATGGKRSQESPDSIKSAPA